MRKNLFLFMISESSIPHSRAVYIVANRRKKERERERKKEKVGKVRDNVSPSAYPQLSARPSS
jgi:hypothetical protein